MQTALKTIYLIANNLFQSLILSRLHEQIDWKDLFYVDCIDIFFNMFTSRKLMTVCIVLQEIRVNFLFNEIQSKYTLDYDRSLFIRRVKSHA